LPDIKQSKVKQRAIEYYKLQDVFNFPTLSPHLNTFKLTSYLP